MIETADLPISTLSAYHKNPRRGDLAAIKGSLQRNGQYRAIVVNKGTKTGRANEVLAGNHTLLAAAELGWELITAHVIDVDEDQAKRIVLVDNRTNDLATYDDSDLLDLLQTLDDLDGTGFTSEDVDELIDTLNDLDLEGEGEEDRSERGGLLEIADLSFADPQHEVHKGDIWRVGKHTLVVANPHTDWPMFRDLLEGDAFLAPYPDVWLTCTTITKDHRLVLVQPDLFLAGHLLDKHASMFPDERIEKIA